MSKKIRVGVIGIGYLGKFHLEKYRLNKSANLTCLVDVNKKNLNYWMNLTKKERYNLSKEDSFNYMDRRKLLLEEIRKEYKEISRENSKKNIKKK